MNWINYLIQSNLFLSLFYGLYWLFLRKETFNTNNRIYLVGSAFLSFLIPFWNSEMVQSWIITRQTNSIIYSYELSGMIIQSSPVEKTGPDALQIIGIIYGLGVFVFLLKFMINIFKLGNLLNAANPTVKAFSFFNRVFVDSSLVENDTIVEHELVHVRQAHSFDVILFEIVSIICWFNPVIYFYKISIKNIHEFIADEIASRCLPSKADYAILLFSRQFQTQPNYLINNFFDRPTLKLRIQMLKKERSARMALLKYGLIVPLFIAMLILTSATISTQTGSEKLQELAGILKKEQISKTVSGKITDAGTRIPLKGVQVYVEGGKRATVSDADGYFTLPDITESSRLAFTTPGYTSMAVAAYGRESFNIALTRSDDDQPPVRFTQAIVDQEDQVFSAVEQKPEFPGGLSAMYRFINQHINYPKQAQRANVSGRVFMKFIVEKDGSISNIEVTRGIGFGCDEESVRVISMMPIWKSGRQNGVPVRVNYNMPIYFQLEDGKDGVKEIRNSTLLLTEPESVIKEYYQPLAIGYNVDAIPLKTGKDLPAKVLTLKPMTTAPSSAGKDLGTGYTPGISSRISSPVTVTGYGIATQKQPDAAREYERLLQTSKGLQATGPKTNLRSKVIYQSLNDPLYPVNGKEISKVNKLKAETPESTGIGNADDALIEYGKKVAGGAIEIKPKK